MKAKQLLPIGLPNLREFIKLYSREWPKYCAEYYCLKSFIRLLEDEPDIRNFQMFTMELNRLQNEPHGLYIILDRYQLYIGCLDNVTDDEMLLALRQLDWSKRIKCTAIPGRHYSIINQIIQENYLYVDHHINTHLYFMPAKEASQIQYEIPCGYFLRSLTEADAELINDLWPNNSTGSVVLIKRQIRYSLTVGMCDEETQELVAWCLILEGGFIGGLRVKDSHKQRGLGSIVIQALAHRMAMSGDDAIALVSDRNIPSMKLFNKLGFKKIGLCYWTMTKSNADDFY